MAARSASGEGDRFDTVVIDPGHGGDDRGALGTRGLEEKTLVLDVSRRLARRLRASGLEVILTRDDDVFVPLEVRTSLANDARSDLFVSVHANSALEEAPRGFETFFVSLEGTDEEARQVAQRENGAFRASGPGQAALDPLVGLLGDMMVSEHVTESSEFSKMVQEELSSIPGTARRGVKQAPFVVLMGVQMPASLIEIGFLSNREDEASLRLTAHREAIAEAVAQAVIRFGKRYDARRGRGDSSKAGDTRSRFADGELSHATRWKRKRSIATDQAGGGLYRESTGFGFMFDGSDASALHRFGGAQCSEVVEGARRGLGHFGVFDAARLYRYSQ